MEADGRLSLRRVTSRLRVLVTHRIFAHHPRNHQPDRAKAESNNPPEHTTFDAIKQEETRDGTQRPREERND